MAKSMFNYEKQSAGTYFVYAKGEFGGIACLGVVSKFESATRSGWSFIANNLYKPRFPKISAKVFGGWNSWSDTRDSAVCRVYGQFLLDGKLERKYSDDELTVDQDQVEYNQESATPDDELTVGRPSSGFDAVDELIAGLKAEVVRKLRDGVSMKEQFESMKTESTRAIFRLIISDLAIDSGTSLAQVHKYLDSFA